MLEQLLADSFAALLKIGAAKLDRVAQDGVRVRRGRGGVVPTAQMLEVCRQEAEERERWLRAELEQDPGAASWRQVAARQRGGGRPRAARQGRHWRSPKRYGRSNKSVRVSVSSGRPGRPAVAQPDEAKPETSPR